MVTRPGRNSPCPCGSGTKYKLCCLPREEEDQARFKGLQRRFEKGDIEQRIACVRDALDKGVLSADLTIEMVMEIWAQARGAGAHRRAVELLEDVQRRAPNLYAAERKWYDKYLVEGDVALGRVGELPHHLSLYASGRGDIDLFFQIIDLLMYHGLTPPLTDAMQQAWPSVRESTEITDWGVHEFADTLAILIVFDYIERADNPDADDPALHSILHPSLDVDRAWLREALDHMLARVAPAWTPRDFARTKARRSIEAPDRVERRLYCMSLHVLRHLHEVMGMPWGRAELGRRALVDYLTSSEHAGAEKDQLSFLHPRRESLDRFLARYFDLISPQRYKTAALLEALPGYLDFLGRCNLIDPPGREAAMGELRSLIPAVIRALELGCADPAAIRNIGTRWTRGPPPPGQAPELLPRRVKDTYTAAGGKSSGGAKPGLVRAGQARS